MRNTRGRRNVFMLSLGCAGVISFYNFNVIIGPPAIIQDVTAAQQNNVTHSNLIIPTYQNKAVATEPQAWLVSLPDSTDETPATICVPPKAGTTSFYRTLYNITHKQEWPFQRPGLVQNMNNADRWTKVNATKRTEWTSFQKHNPAKSIALIRDPIFRILSSWKSKVMCDIVADENGQRRMVPQLLRLAGMELGVASEYIAKDNITSPCLQLSQFLDAMYRVHVQGKDGLLNPHFRPQHLYCFLRANPSRWDIITTIDAPDLKCQMKRVLGISSLVKDDDCDSAIERHHGTGDVSQYANLTARDRAILDVITREEYSLLKPYL